MVEADVHLKLLSTSILDMCKVFEHIDMLSTWIQYHPHTVIPTLLLGSDFGVLGHLWSHNDVIMSWLRLTATSNCFPHPYWTYTTQLSTLICYPWAHSISLTQLYPSYLGQILGFWVTCGVKIMWLCHGQGWQPSETASHIHIRHIQSIWEHWYADNRNSSSLTQLYPPYLAQILGYVFTCGIKMMHFCHGWCW